MLNPSAFNTHILVFSIFSVTGVFQCDFQCHIVIEILEEADNTEPVLCQTQSNTQLSKHNNVFPFYNVIVSSSWKTTMTITHKQNLVSMRGLCSSISNMLIPWHTVLQPPYTSTHKITLTFCMVYILTYHNMESTFRLTVTQWRFTELCWTLYLELIYHRVQSRHWTLTFPPINHGYMTNNS